VATAIKELKNNKAEGIDEIPAELPGPWLTLPLLFLLLLYFLPLYLVVVHYANFVFFFFFYSRAAVSVVFPPCCPVQVLSFALCLHHVFLSELIKMVMMSCSNAWEIRR